MKKLSGKRKAITGLEGDFFDHRSISFDTMLHQLRLGRAAACDHLKS
ncbi:hypothetical protein CEV33_2236 [Brucella grignonensis]|uniref:Uncharacterized protein n=1 Tax=Brucella grignonensis TaxID=94627 RepID=A0A256F7P6_9HYPH|nr:hypothetical protein CEV33_2236 [Brucella grignonensis]